MNLALAITSFVIFTGYLVFILKRFGIIPSISDSYYHLEYSKRGTGLYFSVWCSLVTLFILPPSLGVCNSWYEQVASVLMCVGLIFVGAVPAFKKQRHNIYHIAGTILSTLSVLFLTIYWGYWYLIPSTLIPFSILQWRTKKLDIVLWLEVACFLTYFSSLFLKII